MACLGEVDFAYREWETLAFEFDMVADTLLHCLCSNEFETLHRYTTMPAITTHLTVAIKKPST